MGVTLWRHQGSWAGEGRERLSVYWACWRYVYSVNNRYIPLCHGWVCFPALYTQQTSQPDSSFLPIACHCQQHHHAS
jgi:hypothetical protein